MKPAEKFSLPRIIYLLRASRPQCHRKDLTKYATVTKMHGHIEQVNWPNRGTRDRIMPPDASFSFVRKKHILNERWSNVRIQKQDKIH